MNTTVHREGDRVWLEGVRGWFVGDKESSPHGAQEAAMQAVGESTTYDYLVGVPGLAFRMQVHKDLCPSSPHPCCGFGCVARSTEALPWKVRFFDFFGKKGDDAEKVKEARQAIVESISRGVPVQYGSEEDGLIVGYQKAGDEWLCIHPYRDTGAKTFVETKWPWGFVVFTGPREAMPPSRELALGALRQAVEMARTERSGDYFVGLRAWDFYIERLEALEQGDERARKGAMLGNAWIYECLAQYRGSAARYLRAVAHDFPSEAAKRLRHAADLYDRMSNDVLRDKDHCVVTIAPYPWALKEGQTWTSEMRREQLRRLRAALPLEREALREIEAALAAI